MAGLEGRTAIVTGGSRGIGFAIARALLDGGLRVVIAGRSPASVERATNELSTKKPAQVAGFVCDVRKHADCRRLIEGSITAFGRLDVLVNNAGIGEFGPVGDMRPETWDNIIQTNLSGVFYCTHEAIPHLRQAGNSWIINIGSLAGKNPFAGGAAYNASKFGLLGFSEALMLDVRYEGIRVSCVMPGSVATEFSGRDATSEDWRIAPEDVARVVMDLLAFPERSLPSRVEIRPTKPPRRG
jgi:NAD(P)-dependent dehydrogenase (short-subunit alcohol dehydrogenase family)